MKYKKSDPSAPMGRAEEVDRGFIDAKGSRTAAQSSRLWLMLGLTLAATQIAEAGYQFQTISGPGGASLFPAAINDSGAIVGTAGPDGVIRSPEGNYTVLTHDDHPLTPLALSQNGWIAGFFEEGENKKLFVRDAAGTLTSMPAPAAAPNFPLGINNAGDVVGSYQTGDAPKGFLRNAAGESVDLVVPEAAATYAYSINNSGSIAGTYEDDSGQHGFIRHFTGELTRFSIPGSRALAARSINDAGIVAGFYVDGDNRPFGFVRSVNGQIQTISAPDATQTRIFSLNSSGALAGRLRDAGGNHAFLATSTNRSPGKLYAIGGFDPEDSGMVPHRIYELDPATGKATPLPGSFKPEPAALAATADGRILALNVSHHHHHGEEPPPAEAALVEINPFNGFITKLATVPVEAYGFDIFPDGRAFTIPMSTGGTPVQLHAINLTTGEATPIGGASAIDDAFAAAFGSAPAANKRATQLASVGGHLYACASIRIRARPRSLARPTRSTRRRAAVTLEFRA
jgi:hypothetical protein